MNLDQFRNFTNASETLTIPNPVVFTGGVTVGTTSILGATTYTGNVSFGVDATGVDVTFYGDTTAYKVWWDQNGDTNGAWYFGADTKGVLVNMYGATTGCGVFWDPDGDTNGTLSVGASGGSKGNDFFAYGDTNGSYMQWDRSVNSLKLVGAAALFSVGTFSSATAGSGVALSASTTAATRVYADDGGAKLAAGEKRVSISRFLYATSDTDGTDQTMSAYVGQVKVANDLTIGGNLAGLCGYLEVATTKTLIGGRRAEMSIASGLWGRVDLPSGAVAGTAGIISGLALSADLGGTHTGACSMINVTTPSAGTWDYFLDFGAAPGAIVADTSSLPASATYKIKCRIDSTDFYLIGVADF